MNPDAQHPRAALLEEILEIGMAAARELNAALPEAETPQDKACLATALNRTLRGVRQTVALEARLQREALREVRDASAEARSETQRRVERRKARVAAEIERVLWDEYEQEEAEGLAADLSGLLVAEALDEDFTTEPFEAQVERICRDLRVPSPFNAPSSLAQSPPSPLAGEGGPRSGSDEGSTTLSTGPPNPWT